MYMLIATWNTEWNNAEKACRKTEHAADAPLLATRVPFNVCHLSIIAIIARCYLRKRKTTEIIRHCMVLDDGIQWPKM